MSELGDRGTFVDNFEPRGRYAEIAVDPAPQPIIQALGVRKVYDTGKVTVEALRGVDLDIREGEMAAIMGPSGCGKTTLLNSLSGLDDITSGEVLIAGEPISGMSDRKRTRFRAEKMGFIFQSYNLMPVLSAIENVELPLLVAGAKPRDARKKALRALELVGLSDQANKRPNEMSGGLIESDQLNAPPDGEPSCVTNGKVA